MSVLLAALTLVANLDLGLMPFHLSRLVVDTIWQALLLLALWLCATCDGLGLRSLNPGRKWNKRDGLWMVALVLLSCVFSVVYAYLLRPFLPKENGWAAEFTRNLITLNPVVFGVFALGLALLVGVSEELVFRSYLITRLRACGLPAWPSILMSGLLFGLLHWPNYGFLPALEKGISWGIPAGYFFYRRGSILPLIVAHSFVDALAFTLIYIVARHSQVR